MMTLDVDLNSIDGVKNFVTTVCKMECDVDIVSGKYHVNAKSILGILSLDLTKPVTVRVYADGREGEEAIQMLEEFRAK